MLTILTLTLLCALSGYALHQKNQKKYASKTAPSPLYHTTISVPLLDIPTTDPCPLKPSSFYTAYGIHPTAVLDHRIANPLEASIFVTACATSCYHFSNTRGPDITHWLFTPSCQVPPLSTLHFVLTKIPNSTPKIIAFLHLTP